MGVGVVVADRDVTRIILSTGKGRCCNRRLRGYEV